MGKKESKNELAVTGNAQGLCMGRRVQSAQKSGCRSLQSEQKASPNNEKTKVSSVRDSI